MLKQIRKRAEVYAKYKEYMDNLKEQRASQEDQSLNVVDLAASVAEEILLQKEAARKARNKRKAAKKK